MRLYLSTLSAPAAYRRAVHHSARLSASIGIRSEAEARYWERRAPLTPKAVFELCTTIPGTTVLVQRSEKRIFTDEAYRKAGAQIVDSLEDADIILGIKEVPKEELAPSKTYAFFSHTHKGQPYNLPLLSSMLASGSRYIDWELVTDESGARSTAFGHLAGLSGMSDGLSLFATKALAQRGAATPFILLPRPFMVPDVKTLMCKLDEVGKEIEKAGTPPSLGPLTIAILGKGRVSNGAKEVLKHLPTTWVTVEEMKKVVESADPNLKTIYACQVELSDYLSHAEGLPFDRSTYHHHPQLFFSEFDTKVAPWTTILLNGAFWNPGCPKILTTDQLALLKSSGSPSRMLSVVDVSCDFGGGLEFVTAPTTIDDPVFQFDPVTGLASRDPAQKGTTQITSIEILPSELPVDSSTLFSDSIVPYINSLLRDPLSSSSTCTLSQGLRRATIVENGKLTSSHTKLYDLLASSSAPTVERKRVLVLGSGLVAAPAVQVLAARADLDIVVASNTLDSAQALAEPHQRVTAVFLDADDGSQLQKLIADADVVLSLLPAPLHVGVAKLCISCRSSLVTASYTSTEMLELNSKAKEAGIVILNELGLDPGIDHMSAMDLIERARAKGNTITSFVSFCGGLPSPEYSSGPLGYKFSWSPRGVLTASLNSATFRVNSKEIQISGEDLLRLGFSDVPIIRGLRLEGVANRNSLGYLEEYGLPANLPTILRGTLRYPTFSCTVDAFKRIGLLSQTPLDVVPKRWEDLTDICLGATGSDSSSRRHKIAALYSEAGLEITEETLNLVMSTLEDLSLLPSLKRPTSLLPPIPHTPHAPLDLLSVLLSHQLSYKKSERDIVLLHHELGTLTSDLKPELFTSTLVQYGIPGGDSAMATTVGVPIALGALLLLDERVKARGLVTPSNPEVWKPLLNNLQEHGIRMVERRTPGRGVVATLEKQL